MPKYQIEFNLGGGTKHFKYFSLLDERLIVEFAEKTANEWLKNRLTTYKPPRTVMVREYDEVKKAPKRGCQRRKLRLTFIETKTIGGWKERQEWYQNNE